MTIEGEPPTAELAAEHRAIWRRQVATLPALHGGKRAWFGLVVELIDQVDAGRAVVMEARPTIPQALFTPPTRRAGAAPTTEPSTWHEYSKFLKSLGLTHSTAGGLILTSLGQAFHSDPTPEHFGCLLASRLRLFAEALAFIAQKPSTVEEVDDHLREQYVTTWRSLGGTRDRLDWLDALGLIERTTSRQWTSTATGEIVLAQSTVISPHSIASSTTQTRPLVEAPAEIQLLLNGFETSERTHESRSTYNIWVPSPATSPNKVDNLRTIVNAAVDPVQREELLTFIAETFELQRSSVDSMMPFLRASGLLHEVGLGTYQATAAARAWIESDDDVNFIRILHGHMRFVGEMLRTVKHGVTRPEMYAESAKYGLNVDKSRWIALFLEDAGLIEQPRYGSLIATPTGRGLLAELPLAIELPTEDDGHQATPVEPPTLDQPTHSHSRDLVAYSTSPQALNLGSGKAFEIAVRDAFRRMGFRAEVISGPGSTDVVVQWRDKTGHAAVAVVEAKSRSNGQVSHTDISDVALETHKAKHKADFAAVVGPAFAGDTIKNMANARSWALLTAQQLGEIVDAADELGLDPTTVSQLFYVPNGIDALHLAIEQRRRELALIAFVMSQLAEEAVDTGEGITARDISRDGRKTKLRPTIEEVLDALQTVTTTAATALRVLQENGDPKYTTYALGDACSASSRLRALAKAIDISVSTTNTW